MAEAGDITDVPRISNRQDLSSNGVSSRFITKRLFIIKQRRLGFLCHRMF
jgi:hypothetical protein